MSQSSGPGPGNKVIATTLLESLAVRGQEAARDRAARALGMADAGLAEAKSWLPDDALGQMFIAADTDASLARSVGHRLVAPDATGIVLYSLGLATPEKAYRRVGALLPRDRAASRWIVDEIRSGAALLRFEDHDPDRGPDLADAGQRPPVENRRAQAALCALRVGMLEAIPGLYGLLPAQVSESSCLSRGGDACRYSIHWDRTSRVGLLIGGGIGSALAASVIVVASTLGLPLMASAFPGLCSVVFGVAIGQSFDLRRQLQAVAGARRGHLALFDQVDDALASKLDALARVDAKLEGAEQGFRVDRTRPISEEVQRGDGGTRAAILDVAQQIHAAAGDLECWFENTAGTNRVPSSERDARVLLHQIRDWAAEIAEDGNADSLAVRDSVDLVALVARAVVAARPMLPCSSIIAVEHEDALPSIVCEPLQIEQVVVQLLRNAVEASRGLTESPEVSVSLRRVARGVEIGVEDRGVGIEPSELDEVFDPFFGERSAGIDEGFGLPVCLRIVERHGGEMRIETEDRPGTRVSILLPEAPEPEPET